MYGVDLNSTVSCYIPTDIIKNIYNVNTVSNVVEAVPSVGSSIGETASSMIAEAFASQAKKYYLKKQIQRNPDYINVYKSTTLYQNDGPYTSAHNGQFIYCRAGMIGKFYSGSYWLD